MKSCNNCMHVYVCDDLLTSECQESGECDYYESESMYKYTLRLVYADLIAAANKLRSNADVSSQRGDTLRTSELRRRAEDRESAAARVRFYCRKIGFDPACDKTAGERRDHESV